MCVTFRVLGFEWELMTGELNTQYNTLDSKSKISCNIVPSWNVLKYFEKLHACSFFL